MSQAVEAFKYKLQTKQISVADAKEKLRHLDDALELPKIGHEIDTLQFQRVGFSLMRYLFGSAKSAVALIVVLMVIQRVKQS
ncbi:MAG TPA: hypothetical protein ENK65_01540 [Helicobacteraceae bacterium]|nr:hypothetical protein [Helicobacteraceae bacterium]